MATSGALSTSNQYIKYKITITQNSQNIANNTSNVTVSVKFYRTNTGYTTYGTGTVHCTINGTEYTAAVTSSQKITNSGIVLFSKTLNIAHNADGTKTLAVSAYIEHQQVTSSAQSYSQALTTIARKSTLTASNGTLDTAQTLTINRQSSGFTHTITYKCGTASGTIATKTTATSVSFTPPLSLAAQNTTGTSVSITFTITTYSGSTSIGSNTKTITCSIPAKVVPEISAFTLTEAVSGLAQQFGAFVNGKSKIKFDVTPTLAYNSPIKGYSVSIVGQKFSTKSGTTAVIAANFEGTHTATVTVTDSRGRKATKEVPFTVYDYTPPAFFAIAANRCLENGTLDDEGEYLSFTLDVAVSPVNNKNTAVYSLAYKKTGDSNYTDIPLNVSGYSVKQTTVFASPVFSVDNTYNIRFQVSDYFTAAKPITKNLPLSSAKPILDILADGSGAAFNKVAEIPNVLDLNFELRTLAGVLQPELETGSDFNDIKIPNTYTLKNASTAGYLNCPFATGTGTLTVEVCGNEGQIHQIVSVCSKTNPLTYERFYYQNAWGSWIEKQYDSGWKNCTLQSGFGRYNSTQAPLQIRRIGNVVHLRGAITPTAAVTPSSETSTAVAVIDSVFRPSYAEYVINQGSGANRFILSITPSGNIYISRYSNDTTVNKEITAGAWLNCFATWFIG